MDGAISTTYRNGNPQSVIDGSGLSQNNIEGQHRGENNQFGWQRQGGHYEHPGKYVLVFDLAQSYNLQKGYFWNWADGGGPTRGADKARFYLSSDGGATWQTEYVEPTFAYSLRTAQEFALTGTGNAIKMEFIGVGETNDASGFSEIRFSGIPLGM